MIIIGLFLNFTVVACLCRAPFSLAIHAFPAFVGASASAFFTVQAAGRGELLAVICGVLAGGATWGFGKTAFAVIRLMPSRMLIAILFAGPVDIAGYHLLHGFSVVGSQSEVWRQIINVMGTVAFARLVTDPAEAMLAGGAGQ